MRVTIERGYHPAIRQLMQQIKTDDPKLAVHHALGCFFAGGCQGMNQPISTSSAIAANDDFDLDLDVVPDWSQPQESK